MAHMPRGEFVRRLIYLVNRRRLDRELANDMEFHREMAAREGGVPLGDPLRLREEARDAWGWTWIERFSQDLNYAARILRKSPGFTIAATLMLALGIGVNVAAFGFFNLMVLRPLPVRDPETLLKFDRSAPGNYADNFPYAEVAFFSRNTKTLSAILASTPGKVTLEGDPKPLDANFVTANSFRDLGATAVAGRTLDPARDEPPPAYPVAVLSYRFWQRRFGADRFVIGKTLRLNGKPVTVVGVASEKAGGVSLGSPDIWFPLAMRPYLVSGSNLSLFGDGGTSVFMWGRLQPGSTPQIADAELRSLAAGLRKQQPKEIWEKESFPSSPGGYAKNVGGGRDAPLYPLLTLAGSLCLLIFTAACGNLGSLLLARGVARQREISIRVAVGAGRARLLRQLLTESILLALLGSAAGLVLGYMALRGLMAFSDAPAWLDSTPDWRVLTFSIGIGLLAATLFGLAPAWQAARQRHRATFVRQFLLGGQVAASCVLLIVSGLLVRALNHALTTSPGFEYQHVISIDPALQGYSPAQARVYFDILRGRLRGLPGVESVALVSNPPLGNRWTVAKTEVAGRTVNIHYNHIDSPFFDTTKIPVPRGRTLMPGDTRAVVVSESLARIQWPSEDPIGKRFHAGGDYTVVGVAGSARLVSVEDSDAVEVYQLAEGDIFPSLVALVRTSRAPDGLLPAIASAAKAIDPKLYPEVQLMKEAFQGRVKITQYSALAVGLLGFLALLLACLGIVGLVTYAVSQRRKEIGIRMALGAGASHVLSICLRQFSRPVVAGLVVGIASAAALSQILRRELYGVSNLDPLAYLAAVAVFLVTVIVAALVPARQALRVDPLNALRQD